MSFRSYFITIDKQDSKKIENMTIEQLLTFYNVEDISELLYSNGFSNIIFEFGSYSDYDSNILKITNYLFKKRTTRVELSEYYFKKVNEKNFKTIINMFRKEVANYYKELKEDSTKALKYAEFNYKKWSDEDFPPYNLSKRNKYIIDDNSYEYNVFELVRIYKEIDFDKQEVLFIGH